MELLFASNWQDAWAAQEWLALLVLLGLTFSAAGSFRSERESGALELLLVTPLRAGQVIRGRLQGIRMQYLPAVLTLALAWFCLLPPRWQKVIFQPAEWEGGTVLWLCLFVAVIVSFVTLPVIGLYFSLKRMNHLVSWLCACGVGLLIPWLLFQHVDFIVDRFWGLRMPQHGANPGDLDFLFGLTAALFWQAAAATVAAVLLYANLARGRFIAK
jgi:ABC-type transport system involved in cytochrome c biogenesis permease component